MKTKTKDIDDIKIGDKVYLNENFDVVLHREILFTVKKGTSGMVLDIDYGRIPDWVLHSRDIIVVEINISRNISKKIYVPLNKLEGFENVPSYL